MPTNLETILKHCRLCQQNPGTVAISENDVFINQLDDNCMQVFPKTVCPSCKLIIEEFYSFTQEVHLVNEKLHAQFTECPKVDSLISEIQRANKQFKDSRFKKTYSKTKEIYTKSHCSALQERLNDTSFNNYDHYIKDEYFNITDKQNGNVDNVFSHIKQIDNFQVSDGLKSECDSKISKSHRATFPCTYENCNKVCKTAYTLRNHVMRHEGKLAYLCVTCGKGFATKNSLNGHEKIHAKVKAYVCEQCNIRFSVRSNLRAHQKKHHEGVRFYCSQCTRAFITKCSLERHELVHTGIKKFKCGSCQASFYTNKELLKHQRYHQGIRLYKCELCFKTFFEKHHLTIHIRVHTGEKPYVCKIIDCGKSFTESQKLSRHMKAKHPLS